MDCDDPRRIKRQLKRLSETDAVKKGFFVTSFQYQLSFDPRISTNKQWRLCSSLVNLVHSGKCTPTEALEKIDDRESELLRDSNEREFTVLTSLSLKRSAFNRGKKGPVKRTFSEGVLRVRSDFQDRYRLNEELPEAQKVAPKGEAFPENFARIEVTVEATSPPVAVEKAASVIDYFRGVWEFIAGSMSRDYFKPRPNGVPGLVLNGPIYLIRDESTGEQVTPSLYFDESPKQPPFQFEPKDEERFESENEWYQDIKSSLAPSKFKSFFRAYARSASTVNSKNRLLELWVAIEELLKKGNNDFNKVEDRLRFFAPPEFLEVYEGFMEKVGDARNDIVHTGSVNEPSLNREITQQFAAYLEMILPRVVRFSTNFDDWNEFLDCLSLSGKLEHLRAKREQYDKVIKERESY
jgi:hypothetical protein